MQDGNQVDDHIVLRHAPCQKICVVNIAFQDPYAWQVLNGSGLRRASCDDRHVVAQTGELFTDMAANKTCATQYQDSFSELVHVMPVVGSF